jgi:hypothetical protein
MLDTWPIPLEMNSYLALKPIPLLSLIVLTKYSYEKYTMHANVVKRYIKQDGWGLNGGHMGHGHYVLGLTLLAHQNQCKANQRYIYDVLLK